MGPIVCAVDDSDGARAALGVAHELASRFAARLVLVHVGPPTEAPGVSAAVAGQERLRQAEEQTARELLGRLAEEAGLGAEVALRTRIGPAADRILAVADEEEASVVVIGSRGRGDLASAVLGSVSHAVASRARCPVVVVPPRAVGHLLG